MRRIRVMLTDDHPVVRAGIRSLLERREDITVVAEAEDGQTALRLAKRVKPDVILLDVEMPGMSGVEVARELKQMGSETKILALSAFDDEQYIEGLLEAGASGYLTKEEVLGTIAEAVRGVMRGEEGWLSRRVAAKVVRQKQIDYRAHPSDELSPREIEVVGVLAQGSTNGQIANELGISERTVRFHLHNIYDKLGIQGRGEAIVWAVRNGF